MITDEEIRQCLRESGYVILTEIDVSVRRFAEECYQLGRQHQRESDAALLCELAAYTVDGKAIAALGHAHAVFTRNTGESK